MKGIMGMLLIELRKEKRTGVIPVLLFAGIFGALYAYVNFAVRKETLLRLPKAPTDMLLTQLYGVILVLNMFGVIAAACMIYHMEFGGSAIKKLYMLPIRISHLYLCKFIVLTVSLAAAIGLESLAFLHLGLTGLPTGTFKTARLIQFMLYALITSMPVLTFMLMIASRSENMWVPLGIGVAGFLSGMAFASVDTDILLLHPFVLMLRPAVAANACPDPAAGLMSLIETAIFLCAGLILSAKKHYE